MLKLLKAKVLGASGTAHTSVVPNVRGSHSDKMKHANPHVIGHSRGDACVPHDFDVIHIDSLSSSTESALSEDPNAHHHPPVQYSDPCSKVRTEFLHSYCARARGIGSPNLV